MRSGALIARLSIYPRSIVQYAGAWRLSAIIDSHGTKKESTLRENEFGTVALCRKSCVAFASSLFCETLCFAKQRSAQSSSQLRAESPIAPVSRRERAGVELWTAAEASVFVFGGIRSAMRPANDEPVFAVRVVEGAAGPTGKRRQEKTWRLSKATRQLGVRAFCGRMQEGTRNGERLVLVRRIEAVTSNWTDLVIVGGGKA